MTSDEMLTRVITLGMLGLAAATGGAGQLAGGQLEGELDQTFGGGTFQTSMGAVL